MANPRIYVEPPARSVRKGGIKLVANFVPMERGFAAEALEWVSASCTEPQRAPGLCWGEPFVGTKTPGEPYDYESTPIFALYAGVECFLNVGSDEEYAAEARSVLEAGEDRPIEEFLFNYLVNENPNPGETATGWVDAIAQADNLIDGYIPGGAMLVMNRGDAVRARAASALDGDKDGNLWTANGTPVIASYKVTAGQFAVTGAITVWHSDIVVTNAEDVVTNRAMAIAERAYAIGIDCGAWATFTVTE